MLDGRKLSIINGTKRQQNHEKDQLLWKDLLSKKFQLEDGSNNHGHIQKTNFLTQKNWEFPSKDFFLARL